MLSRQTALCSYYTLRQDFENVFASILANDAVDFVHVDFLIDLDLLKNLEIENHVAFHDLRQHLTQLGIVSTAENQALDLLHGGFFANLREPFSDQYLDHHVVDFDINLVRLD